MEVVVGRQAIFDGSLDVVGYEILFRSDRTAQGAEVSETTGDLMTADVILGSLTIGIDRLVGDRELFCNASHGVLSGLVSVVLPAPRTVLEIHKGTALTDSVVEGCRRLRGDGFALALDAVTRLEDVDRFKDLVSIVKVDLQTARLSELAELVTRCGQDGMLTVAQKVERQEDFEYCRDIGFDFFQGYLLARPGSVVGHALSPGQMAQMRLATLLLSQEVPLNELEEVFRADPALSLQLLRFAAAGAAYGMRRAVGTLREALVLVGWRRLQRWLSLIMISNAGQISEDRLTTSLVRARMCELLAPYANLDSTGSAFVAGMLSSFDLLLGVSLDHVIDELPIEDEVREAVLYGYGPLGALLADVKAYQLGHIDEASRSGLDGEALGTASLEALLWSVEMTSECSESALA